MKTFLFTFLILIFGQSVHSQILNNCISGPISLSINQSGSYSVSSSLGQCANCYDWDVTPSSVALIIGSDQGNTVTIKRITAGDFTITVNYLNENGCNNCERKITERIDIAQCVEPVFDPCRLISNNYKPVVGTNCDVILELREYDTNATRFQWFARNRSNPQVGAFNQYYDTNNPSVFPTIGLNQSRFTACQGDDLLEVKVIQTCSNGSKKEMTWLKSPDAEYCYVQVGEVPGFEGDFGKSFLYPNPAKQEVNIIDTKFELIKILDISGNEMMRLTMESGNTIDISALKKGIYIVQLFKNDDSMSTEKLIVK